MSNRSLTVNNVNYNVNLALTKIKTMCDSLANSGDANLMKKADTFAFWLRTLSDYLQSESSFDYTSLPRYKRGDVISVNLGFNVGSEQGGLHYAVVVSKITAHRSPVLTVIPLTSGTQEKTYKHDVYLGSEIYDKLTKKYNDEENRLQDILKNCASTLSLLTEIASSENSLPAQLSQSVEEHLQTVKDENDEAQARLKKLQTEEKSAIDRLKSGTIALMGQITTVSKIRIYKPKSKNDLMYGLKLSDGAMDKINEKLREWYIYEEK